MQHLPDHLLDRLLGGRAWIGVVAFALIGIVAMQLWVVKLGVGIGRALEHTQLLQQENSVLAAEDSTLSSAERVERLALAKGMAPAPPGALHFDTLRGPLDARLAVAALAKPLQPQTPTSASDTETSPSAVSGAETSSTATSGTETSATAATTGAQTSSTAATTGPETSSTGAETGAGAAPGTEAASAEATTAPVPTAEAPTSQTHAAETPAATAPAATGGSSEAASLPAASGGGAQAPGG